MNQGKLILAVCIALTVLALLAMCVSASAADININWTPPTEYINGTPLAVEEIESYELGCSNITGIYTDDVRTWPSTLINMRTETFNEPGTWYCALRVKALDTFNDDFSEWSNEVSFIIRSRPNPPIEVSVTVEN